MQSSSRRGISYPNQSPRTDRPDVPLHFKNLVDFLDVDVVYAQGTNAARLASGHTASGGRFFWTTDTLLMWYDDGTNWQQVSVDPTKLTGYQLDYAQITSAVNVTATTEGAATSVIPGNAVTYDGSRVKITFDAPLVSTATGGIITVIVTKDGTSLGYIYAQQNQTSGGADVSRSGACTHIFDTPSAGSHTYAIKAYVNTGTGAVTCGAGGSGAYNPAFMQVVRA